MARWICSITLLFSLCVCGVGCGVRELGPANPDETPVVDEADIQQRVEEDTPPEFRNMYRKQ